MYAVVNSNSTRKLPHGRDFRPSVSDSHTYSLASPDGFEKRVMASLARRAARDDFERTMLGTRPDKK